MHPWKHFRTITRHRHLVMLNCFRVGLIRQGLCHDLSKYSPTEFRVGAKYFVGIKSPNVGERNDIGWSTAWMHHKGRNRHHFEYWTDLSPVTHRYEAVPMPDRYVAEMVMDRIAACKVYKGKAYTQSSALDYLENSMEKDQMHPQTYETLHFLLTMLRDQGEKETFRYIRKEFLHKKREC